MKVKEAPESKPILLTRPAEPQNEGSDSRAGYTTPHDPLMRISRKPGIASSAVAHASILNRLASAKPCRARNSLMNLQTHYGNRYVQRVLTLAQKRGAPTSSDGAEAAPGLQQRIQSARGGGQALDKRLRGQMEPAFCADFSGVRVHTDGEADRLNRKLNARAFATGQDIFFRQGAYNPGSSVGRELMAHELTHVVQQKGDVVQPKLVVGQPGDRYEQEADQVAQAVVGQKIPNAPTWEGQGPVQRQVEEEDEALQKQAEEEEETLQKQAEEEPEKED